MSKFSNEKEIGMPPAKAAYSPPPAIGDFSFEKEGHGKAERPPLETFVTASEAVLLDGKEGRAF
jgi:hypothetical protein